jgi:hypothetical protein
MTVGLSFVTANVALIPRTNISYRVSFFLLRFSVEGQRGTGLILGAILFLGIFLSFFSSLSLSSCESRIKGDIAKQREE